jgi:hypothetical protein
MFDHDCFVHFLGYSRTDQTAGRCMICVGSVVDEINELSLFSIAFLAMKFRNTVGVCVGGGGC